MLTLEDRKFIKPLGLLTNELMTILNYNKDLLIFVASTKEEPSASVLFSFSLPARSIRCNLLIVVII